MIGKLLIANRGEVATRVIRTARRLGIGTVAIHSEADARALHALSADERVLIGAGGIDSYVKVEQILAAAQQTGADAVHPGYALLAESVGLAGACVHAGLTFVGPALDALDRLGSKVDLRQQAQGCGLPVVPGSERLASVEAAVAAAATIGYPVLLKADAGGAGVGVMRIEDEASLRACFAPMRHRLGRSLGNDDLYLEKVLDRPRHIDVQLAADHHGQIVHLGEREGSLQRRRQKMIDEAPSPGVTAQLRRRMTDAAITLARSAGLCSLASVEFLLCGEEFFVLGMKTRLQVGHATTEMITGIDLVEWQIRIALGEPLPARQEEITFDGHAVQCRILAEDPLAGFAPSTGQIGAFLVPVGPGLRNDVGVRDGDFVAPTYDPLIARLVSHGADRAAALAGLAVALDSYRVEGVVTNLELHRRAIGDQAFRSGDYATDFVAERLRLA